MLWYVTMLQWPVHSEKQSPDVTITTHRVMAAGSHSAKMFMSYCISSLVCRCVLVHVIEFLCWLNEILTQPTVCENARLPRSEFVHHIHRSERRISRLHPPQSAGRHKMISLQVLAAIQTTTKPRSFKDECISALVSIVQRSRSLHHLYC